MNLEQTVLLINSLALITHVIIDERSKTRAAQREDQMTKINDSIREALEALTVLQSEDLIMDRHKIDAFFHTNVRDIYKKRGKELP